MNRIGNWAFSFIPALTLITACSSPAPSPAFRPNEVQAVIGQRDEPSRDDKEYAKLDYSITRLENLFKEYKASDIPVPSCRILLKEMENSAIAQSIQKRNGDSRGGYADLDSRYYALVRDIQQFVANAETKEKAERQLTKVEACQNVLAKIKQGQTQFSFEEWQLLLQDMPMKEVLGILGEPDFTMSRDTEWYYRDRVTGYSKLKRLKLVVINVEPRYVFRVDWVD